MTEITASLVKELRDSTGAGMMDCKRALVDSDGDIDAARKLLREKGMAQAAKRAGRETTEGAVLARVVPEEGRGTIVAVGCETEPVSNNEEFKAFAEEVLQTVERGGPEAAAGLEQHRVELIGKLGENIVVVGAARFKAGEGEKITAYVHGAKQGVLVRGRGSDEALLETAMHLSWARPRFMTRDEAPEDEVGAERAIYENSDEVKSKPENVRDKIVEGMLGKRYFAQVPGGSLGDQPWTREPSKTTKNALAEAGVEVLEFAYFSVAG